MNIKDYLFKLLKITPSSVNSTYVSWRCDNCNIEVFAEDSRNNTVDIKKLSIVPHTYKIYCYYDISDRKSVPLTPEEVAIVDQRLFELWNEKCFKVWDKFKEFIDEREQIS